MESPTQTAQPVSGSRASLGRKPGPNQSINSDQSVGSFAAAIAPAIQHPGIRPLAVLAFPSHPPFAYVRMEPPPTWAWARGCGLSGGDRRNYQGLPASELAPSFCPRPAWTRRPLRGNKDKLRGETRKARRGEKAIPTPKPSIPHPRHDFPLPPPWAKPTTVVRGRCRVRKGAHMHATQQ
jgi:hypothetical protein